MSKYTPKCDFAMLYDGTTFREDDLIRFSAGDAIDFAESEWAGYYTTVHEGFEVGFNQEDIDEWFEREES